LAITMDSQLLALLQLTDSNFPSGAFSHSYGLETYIQDGAVFNKEAFFEWMRTYLERQLAYTDGLACRFAIDFFLKVELERIWELDQKLYAMNLPEETRLANRRIGDRLIQMGKDIFPVPFLETYRMKIRKGEAYGHPAIVFASICDYLSIDRHQTILTFLYSTVGTLVQNGVRGIPLGQTAGQQILLELHPHLIQTVKQIEEMAPDDFGAAAPGIEIAQMRHERLCVRLFMS